MYKKLVFLILITIFVCVSSVNAKTIAWISMDWDADGDGVVDSQGWVDKLEAEGYTVDFRPGYWDALTQAKVNELNSADLVIFSATIQSGTYASNAAEIELWNSVTAPMLCCSPYILRSDRWNWFNINGALPNDGDQGSPLMEAVMPEHTIFYGITLDENNHFQAVNPELDSGNASFLGTVSIGNGTLIAKTVNDNWFWVTEWQTGIEFYNGSGTYATNHRMYFSIGFHETGGFPARAYNLTDEGWKLYLNTVKYMIGDAVNPEKASSPYPANFDSKIPVDINLNWMPGISAATHNLFFGISEANVAAATTADQMGTTLYQDLDINNVDLPKLKYDTTYYWRVDEMPDNILGDVWSFSTEPEGIDLTFDNIVNVTADTPTLFYPTQEPNMTCNGSGLNEDDLHSTSVENTMWLGVGAVYGDTWIQYEFDQIYKFHEILVWNYNEPDPGQWFGAKDVNITYSEDGQVWKALDDLVQLNIADGADGYAANTTVELDGAIAKYIKITFYDSWMDGIIGGGLSEVRFSVIPTRVMNPDPGDEAADVELDQVLSWKPGRDADSHTLYLGSDPNEVKAGNAEIIADTDDATYAPVLALATTYYWKVDEVNDNEAYPVWDGPVWSFSTVNSILVEGFEEGYDDSDVNAVFMTWIDGYEDPANGSVMGNTSPPYLSETSHDGDYSCPMTFDNTAADYSEVVAETANLPIGTSDWSIGSPKKLTIWIMGDIDNVVGDSELYCKIGGKTAIYDGSLDALTRDMWIQWDIDLEALGANLSNVPDITIGVKTKTGGSVDGSGVLFLDDIMLSGQEVTVPGVEIYIEAEDYTSIKAGMEVLTVLEGAVGGQYVGVTDGTGNALNPPVNDANTAIYTFEIVEEGIYQFDFRVYGYGGSNSFWLQIPEITDINDIKASNGDTVTLTDGWINTNNMNGAANWHWDTVLSANNGNRDLEWHLTAGTYTFKVGLREDGFMLDAMLISKIRDE